MIFKYKSYFFRRMLKIKVYHLISALFWIIRQFAIPNPFETLGDGIKVVISGTAISLSPEILNWIADPIISGVTFLIVGLYYISGSAPTVGSILYMVFYAIHIGLLYLLLSIYPTVWLIVLIVILYIAIHIALIIKTRLL